MIASGQARSGAANAHGHAAGQSMAMGSTNGMSSMSGQNAMHSAAGGSAVKMGN